MQQEFHKLLTRNNFFQDSRFKVKIPQFTKKQKFIIKFKNPVKKKPKFSLKEKRKLKKDKQKRQINP